MVKGFGWQNAPLDNGNTLPDQLKRIYDRAQFERIIFFAAKMRRN
jgi:hypothetical protein